MPGIAAITAYASLKLIGRRMSHHLRENGSATIHTPLSGPSPGRADPPENLATARKKFKSKNLLTRVNRPGCYGLPAFIKYFAGRYWDSAAGSPARHWRMPTKF